MKFLCLACDQVMDFADRRLPGDGTMAAVFGCPTCGREIALLANPMETQIVSSMGVKIGGREVPEQPMELVRSSLADGRDDAFDDADSPAAALAEAGAPGTGEVAKVARVTWSEDATERLGNVPSFVRGMVKRIYADYARERGIARITPEVMDTARTELGLEGM